MNIEDLISQYIDGALSPEAESELHHRLAVSPEARKLFRAHIMLRGMARDQRVLHAPTQGMRSRLFERLQQEEGMSAVVGSGAIEGAGVGSMNTMGTGTGAITAPVQRSIPSAAVSEPGRRKRRRMMPWLLPLVIAGAMFVFLWSTSDRNAESPVMAVAEHDGATHPAAPASGNDAPGTGASDKSLTDQGSAGTTLRDGRVMAESHDAAGADAAHGLADVPSADRSPASGSSASSSSANGGAMYRSAPRSSSVDDATLRSAEEDMHEGPSIASAEPERVQRVPRAQTSQYGGAQPRHRAAASLRAKEGSAMDKDLAAADFAGNDKAEESTSLEMSSRTNIASADEGRARVSTPATSVPPASAPFPSELDNTTLESKGKMDGTLGRTYAADTVESVNIAADSMVRWGSYKKELATMSSNERYGDGTERKQMLGGSGNATFALGDKEPAVLDNSALGNAGGSGLPQREERYTRNLNPQGPEAKSMNVPPPPPPAGVVTTEEEASSDAFKNRALASSMASEPRAESNLQQNGLTSGSVVDGRAPNSSPVNGDALMPADGMTARDKAAKSSPKLATDPPRDVANTSRADLGGEDHPLSVQAPRRRMYAVVGVGAHSLANVTALSDGSSLEFVTQTLLKAGIGFGRHQIVALVGMANYRQVETSTLYAVRSGGVTTVLAQPEVTSTTSTPFDEMWGGIGYQYAISQGSRWDVAVGGWIGGGDQYLRTGLELPISYRVTRVLRLELVPLAVYVRRTGSASTSSTVIDPAQSEGEQRENVAVPERAAEILGGFGLGVTMEF